MNTKREARRRWPWAVPPLMTLVLAGCQFSFFGLGGQSDEEQALLRRQFNEQLALSTRAINDADLAGARTHLQAARESASSDVDVRKVESLEKLVTGAEALLEGDAMKARTEWSAIEDPALRHEVRRKAKAVGMVIPAASAQSGAVQAGGGS